MQVDPSLPEWEGPVQLACSLFSENHMNTVRYKVDRYPHVSFYVPYPFLSSVAGDAIPRQIVVVLSKSPAPTQTLGFKPLRIAPRTTPDFWEFDFSEMMGRVARYDVRFAGQKYTLYVPKEVFGGYVHPGRLLVQLAVPDEPSQ